MNRKRIVASLFALLLLGLPVSVADEGSAARTRPHQERLDRPQVRKPVERQVPETLVIVKRELPAPAGPSQKGLDPVALQADRAARRMAEELAGTTGWVEYYRVGWFRGMNRALKDRSLGDWDRIQGFETGVRDREARRTGLDLGRTRAEEMAATAAAEQVEAQFRDLNRDPMFDPRPITPRFQAEGLFAQRPELDELSLDVPVLSLAAFADRERRQRFRKGFDGWDVNPDRLRQIDRFEQFHDGDWADPARAFRLFKRSSRNSAIFRRMDEADRIRFRQRFLVSFSAWLGRFYDRFQEPAFAHGFDDGWEYGAWLQYEISFREGFADGFDQAVRSAADASFQRTWGRAFNRFYEASFDDWMSSVRPVIVDLQLEDGDRDGVFEPGESLDAFFTLANLGGGSGERTLNLRGRVLDRPRERTVRFQGRGRVNDLPPLTIRIADDVPVRTRGRLELTLAGESKSTDLLVARPLQFEGGWRIDSRDALRGVTVVDVQIANRSRKPVTGSLGIVEFSGDAGSANRDLGQVAAGEVREVRFRLDGLDPLDILSGELRLSFQAADGVVVHDGLDIRFPNLAVDLGNDDLVTLMLRLASDPSASRRDVDRARSLMLERMKADWRIVARGRNNPYKQDFRNGKSGTAMGELVRRTAEVRGAMVRPEIIVDLGDDLIALSRELPGAHPFLRKWFRKLAAKI
ncbi:MAG: hypothetical protein IFK94_08210 [Acidobacteria bacterium]|uniref:Uncharacterized protein n=1 Tax=Candidatus Polarisedimenticola svalbardensis TaxID=2886004 RepID=A0A8J6Y3U5_9BACT|nr:hypothetical protein [Candidatus Polarisedimenticola svalbardensis]